MTSLTRILLLSTAFALSANPLQAQEIGYYHSADTHENTLVFSSEGDLWRANSAGSVAQRLTTHEEVEVGASISPDGRQIAFNASYDGANEVYVMPVGGGAPKQLTFEGGGVEVRGWSPDGRVLYTTTNIPGTRPRALRLADPDTGKVDALPLLSATDGTFSADGSTLYFTRYGLELSRDNVHQYKGGRVAQLWRYDIGSDTEAVRIAASFDAPIRDIMVWNDRIYFVSDKSGYDNIWSVAADGTDAQQHSQLSGWQLRDATMENGVVTYQKGADLFRYDISASTETKLDVWLTTDRDGIRQRWLDEPLAWLTEANMAGDGSSVALTARGRAALTYPGDKRRVELAIPATARARAVTPSPDGTKVWAVLDQGKRGEIWEFSATGGTPPKQVTSGSDAHIWEIIPSPDGSSLVYDDKAGRLWRIDLESGTTTQIRAATNGDDGPFSHINWSKNGRYLVFTETDERNMRRVAIHDFETKQTTRVTTGKYESFAGTFSADGKWLWFVSNRNFSATPSGPWGDRNLGPQFDKRGTLFALQLVEGSPFPFEPADELADDSDKADTDEETSDDADPAINFDGIAGRLWQLPVAPDNYVQLRANEGYIYAVVPGDNGAKITSIKIDETKAETKTFASGLRGFDLSLDGKTAFIQRGRGPRTTLALVPARAEMPKDLDGRTLRVGDWRLGISPKEEWKQILFDAWRLHRDFAFDPNLRGVDWDAVGDTYLPLADRVGHRIELADLMGQMTAELGILHSQIGSGDLPDDEESAQTASLGAVLEETSAGLQVLEIFQGEADRPSTLGPLLAPGVDIRVGDVITAVDGQSIDTHADLYRALANKSGQQIRIDYDRERVSYSEIVEPVNGRTASALRYRHWVEMNRRAVAAASDGQFGYLHLEAMGGRDIASFARDFYEHFDKDGVIIDVRGNRGGNIDAWILQALNRQAWAFWKNPNGGDAYTNMQQAFRGHLVVLIDEGTYSDGETFSAGVKALGLGELIGTRTAGAGIWLSDRNRLADGGIARVAEFPQFGLDGRWLIEGYGVEPDIEVINPPLASYNGGDAQLDAAIARLQERIAEVPIPELVPNAIPPVGVPGSDVD